MRNVRTFSESTIDKLDNTIKYLTKNSIPFSAHWIKANKKSIERMRQDDSSLDEQSLPVLKIIWFS